MEDALTIPSRMDFARLIGVLSIFVLMTDASSWLGARDSAGSITTTFGRILIMCV